MPISRSERLRISLHDRCWAFTDQVNTEMAQTGSTGNGVRNALRLFAHYSISLAQEAEVIWKDAPGEAYREATMRALAQHLKTRIELFDSRFRRGHASVPQALSAQVEHECAAMGASGVEAVITIGQPMNFSTFVPNLREYLFKDLENNPGLPADLSSIDQVLIAVPDLEGSHVAWHPIVAGHEIAHFLQHAVPLGNAVPKLGLQREILAATTDQYPSPGVSGQPRVRALEQIAVRWLNEIICDAYSVFRYGAAGAASFIEFLGYVGSSKANYASHPPGQLRTRLMLLWLGSNLSATESEIIEPVLPRDSGVTYPDWAQYLYDAFTTVGQSIFDTVAAWVGGDSYQNKHRSDVVAFLADQFCSGIPGAEIVPTGRGGIEATSADIVNATWLASHRTSTMPVNRLALKALDALDFLDRWKRAGGEASVNAGEVQPILIGALSEGQIRSRIASDDESRLVVTPLLPGAVKGASLDLRLGNRFIVFERTGSAAFDSLDENQDPRSMQTAVEKSWGDVFYLHPGQLVLAATLEYLYLPPDLTAQVITRSSYGRLGLMSATAVQVHPRFAGCLTLELVNLGEMPMAITPGERIAQLMLFRTTAPTAQSAEDLEKYRYPTGPEFSKIRTDSESAILRGMRTDFRSRRGL